MVEMGLEEGTSSGEGTWCGRGLNASIMNRWIMSLGIKLDSLFHLSLMNSRMKDGAYEQSPMLFSSDIQHVPSFPDDIAMALIEEELGHPW
ncbi:hypothetical protein V6N12_020070 [Hibiscus sabdariffa]|uniref:Uncharacterized protein n=1 Tax=Hibiscus sabdariffa TaxID=183260 RepID=A0ABR2ARH4_9ROSI